MKIINKLWRFLQIPFFRTDRLYLAPLVIPAIMAGAGAIGNILGESEEEKRNRERKQMIAAYLKRIDENNKRRQKEKEQSDLLYGGKVGERRSNYDAVLASKGLDVSGSNYANEKDLINANIYEKQGVDTRYDTMNADINSNIDMLNAGMEKTPGFAGGVKNFLSGAVKGFTTGAGISQALQGVDTTDTTIPNPLLTTEGKPSGYYPRLEEGPSILSPNPLGDLNLEDWYVDENGILRKRTQTQ